MTTHSMVYGVSGDSYSDLKALKNAGIIDCHYIIHGGGSSPPSGFVADCNAAGVSPVLNNGNDGAAGWNGSDSYNANVAAMGFHAVGGESEQAGEIDSIMNHLIFLDYGGEGTGGGTNDCVWCSTHSAPVHGFGAASYMETYDSATNLWGWNVMAQGMQSAKAHGVKEIGLCVGTWMINHSTAQDYVNIANQMEANGITCAGMVIWGGYGSNMNSVYNEFASWFKAWQAIWPPETRTMKQRFAGPTPPPPSNKITFVSTPVACSMLPGRLDAFAQGSNGELWHAVKLGTAAWGKWQSLGGSLTSAPSVAARGGNKIDIVVRGPDPWGACYLKQWNGTVWLDWQSLRGDIYKGTGPSISSQDANSVDIFALGTDQTTKAMNGLFKKSMTNGVWGDWTAVSAVIQG